jgi:hypothetical protein
MNADEDSDINAEWSISSLVECKWNAGTFTEVKSIVLRHFEFEVSTTGAMKNTVL